MRIFMIDLENVRSSGLEGVLSLDKNDTVFIFYSDNAYNLTIPTLESINNSKATVKYIKTNYLGANAMDFQIVSLYGAMIERYKNGYFYIISHDHGFRSAVSFCQAYFESYDIRVGVYDNILAAITAEVKELMGKKSSEKNTKQQVQSDDGSEVTKKPSKRSRSKKKKSEQIVENTEQIAEISASETSEKADMNKYADTIHNDAKNGANVVKSTVAANSSVQKDIVSENSDQAEPAQADAPASGDAQPKKKRRRRRKSNKSVNPEQTADAASEVGEEEDDSAASTQEASAPAPKKEQKQQQKSANAPQNSPNTAKSAKSDYSYIYRILGELLSAKTIDVYAEGIHKAVIHSSNKDELHSYFKKKFGEDEGEALYRVVQSDFEEMKKLAK